MAWHGARNRTHLSGPPPRFSGLQECGICGGAYVIQTRAGYGCARRKLAKAQKGAENLLNAIKRPSRPHRRWRYFKNPNGMGRRRVWSARRSSTASHPESSQARDGPAAILSRSSQRSITWAPPRKRRRKLSEKSGWCPRRHPDGRIEKRRTGRRFSRNGGCGGRI